ncbi:MAG: hypothetical protein U1F40_12225 [Turneriella sp.]
MSKFKRHLKVGLLLVVAAAFALNCARGSKTPFAQNLEKDADKPAPTYSELVALIGQEKADKLYAGIGQDNLNVLFYGIGQSNMVQLINAVTQTDPNATDKLVTLIGNDFISGNGPGSRAGIGAIITLFLIKEIDNQMSINLSANLVAAAPPSGNNTVLKLAHLINNATVTAADLDAKLVAMMGPTGFNLPRNLSTGSGLLVRLSKVVAHVDYTVNQTTKLNTVISTLTAADVINKLAPLVSYQFGSIADTTWGNKLVETMQTSSAADLVTVLQSPTGVTAANVTAKMGPLLNEVDNCTKLGYTITQVGLAANLPTLINIINNVTNPVRMGQLINRIENPASYTAIQTAVSPQNWIGGSQTFGSPTLAAPYGTAGTGGAISVTIAGGIVTGFSGITAGSGYHTDLTYTNVFAGCSAQPVLRLAVVAGALSTTPANHIIANAGTGCNDGSFALTLSDPVNTSGMARLVTMINTLPAAEYYKVLNLVDAVTEMDKLVMLVQDGKATADLVQMLDAMTPNTQGAGCTGILTVTGGTQDTAAATATGFVSGGGLAYINVTNVGDYTVAPTGVTDAGCGAVPVTVTTTGVSPNIQVSMIAINTLPVNSMAQLLQNIDMVNIPRLREVVDGQRIFNNTGTQAPAATAGTYLQKMVTLITNLDQTLEGPLKVTQMINGVTNTDKIIDLVYQVTNTSNLSSIINQIFSASLGTGCSDAPVSAYDASFAVCDNLGGTVTAGNGFVYGPKNNAVNTLVYVVQNVTNSANLVAMINGASPTQMKDLINHVSVGSQVEDPASALCATCTGAAAATATNSAAGMKLVKVIDYPGLNPHDLSFVINNVSAVVKMAKLINLMRIGQTTTGLMGPNTEGTGKLGRLLQSTLSPAGNCWGADNAIVGVTGLVGGTGYTAGATVTFTGAGGTGAVGVATVDSAGVITAINVANDGQNYGGTGVTITPVSGGAGASATAVIGSCGTTRGLQQINGTNPMSNIGKGKVVNMIDYIAGASHTAAMTQLAYVVNNVNDVTKLADMINKVPRSSNVVALLNAIIDPANNTSTTDLVNLLDQLPTAEIHKLTGLVQQLNSAVETGSDTLAQADQNLVAQLMAPYATETLASGALTSISNGSPGVVTWAGHGLTAGRQVMLSTAGTLPAPLDPGQLYYVAATPAPTANTFSLALVPGGAAINTTTAGAGAHSAVSNQPTATSGVGTTRMTQLLGSLPMTNGTGTGYPGLPTPPPTISFGAGCTTVPTATATVASGQVTRVDFTSNVAPNDAPECTAAPSLALAGGAGTGADIDGVMPFWASRYGANYTGTNLSVASLYVTNGGSGYTTAPTVTTTGCNYITATTHINGLSSIDVTGVGAGCTSAPTVTISGGGGATATALVAGELGTGAVTVPTGTAALVAPTGGRNYVATHSCPITGAGGSGGLATITTVGAGGAITALNVTAGGSDYISGQTITIGGAARAYAVVSATGVVAAGAGSISVSHTGCGYTAIPTVTVEGCTVNPTATAALNGTGGVGTITVTVAGSGCPRNPRVIITDATGTTHGDGATAVVGNIVNGTLVGVSMSAAADNLANVLANTEKAPLYTAINYASNQPNISAREAMIRLLHHGVVYSGTTFPGVGPAHLGYNVMGGINSGTAISTVITMMNADTISLADLDVLIGCADRVFYGPTSNTDFEAACRNILQW